MSQSRTANIKIHSDASLKLLDLGYAVLLHVLVFSIIIILAFWQTQHKTEPLKRIEVMMISAADLAKLERPSTPKIKPKPIKRTPIKTKPKAKKPIIKPKPKMPKPLAKAKVIKKPIIKAPPVVKVDDDFDPFAPLASSSDINRASPMPQKKVMTPRPELADLIGKQLSHSEKERYIALMQAAVQRHWKIAASAASFTDPLVEMKLLPTGHIASIHVLESSGNAAMDASLIRAIKAAAPFELPREQFEFFRTNRIRFHPLK